MSHELWLKQPREVLLERGFGITHVPGDVAQRLTGTLFIDPVTGFACAPLVVQVTDGLVTDYLPSAEFTQGSCHDAAGNWGTLYCHTTTGAFTATVTPSATYEGEGVVLALLPYTGAGALTISWGTWRLVIDAGVVELQHQVEGEWITQDLGLWWTVDEWDGRLHWMFVYSVGRLLAVRPVGRREGLRGVDPGLADGYGLARTPWTVASTGRWALGAWPERHGTSLAIQHPTIWMPEVSTQTPVTEVIGVAPPRVGEDEAEDPSLTITEATKEGQMGFSYALAWTLQSARGPNAYVSAIRVRYPALSGSDGLTAVDLNALPGAALRSVREHLSLTPGDGSLGFEVLADPGELSPYVQANMYGVWSPSGTARRWFLTDRPTCDILPANKAELLRFEAKDLWKRFETQLWPGGKSYAGWLLAEAYRDLAAHAGLPASAVNLYSGGYRLPEDETDDAPAVDLRSGQSIAECLTYLRDTYGATDQLRFGSDGELYVEHPDTAASATTFYVATPAGNETGTTGVSKPILAHIAARTSAIPRILRASWSEQLDESGLRNEIWVVGQDLQDRPIVAFKTDWSSINDPTATNYVGEVRRMVIIDAGLRSQAVVNWVCAEAWARLRRLRIWARFRAQLVSALLPGDIVTIEGKGQWRLLTMDTLWDRHGPMGLTEYEVERYVA